MSGNLPPIDGIEDEHLHIGMAAVASALHNARIEVEGYRRDAERYRFLRSGHHFETSGLFAAKQGVNGITRVTLDYADTLIDSEMRRLIDGKVAE